MKRAAPLLPPILEAALPVQFASESTIETCRFDNADWTALAATSVSLDEVLFEKCSLAGASLKNFSAQDAVFKNCDLSATTCAEASLQRITFSGGRMTGWDCSKGMLKDVCFENCKLDMANFRFMKLVRVRFYDCILTETDFLGAELHDVSFEACHLERTNFSQCKLKNVDLRSSQLIALLGWQYLKGATIDNIQLLAIAPYLAAEIGIKVSD